MQNHVVICGYGRNGQQVAKELKARDHQFVVIDQNRDVVIKNIDKSGGFIEGDATQDELLIKANIKSARALISTLPLDADNLYVVLTARALNPDLEIICRASNESSEKKMRMAGVDNVVMPERVGGAHMANLVTNPDVIEFMDHVSVHGDDPTSLEEFECPEIENNGPVKTIGEYAIRRKTGANIIGFKALDGSYILNPKPDTKLIPGSKLFVLGTPDQVNEMKKILQGDDKKHA
jgi:voltage-gated potassium channel